MTRGLTPPRTRAVRARPSQRRDAARASLTDAARGVVAIFRAYRLRATLIVACTGLGISFPVAVVALIEAAGRYVEHDVLGRLVGFNTVQVRRLSRPDTAAHNPAQQRADSRRPALTFEDAEWLAAQLVSRGTVGYEYRGTANITAIHAPTLRRATIVGASASQFAVQDLVVERGRAFTVREADEGASVAVLGPNVAARLFGGANPLGADVRIEGRAFRIVGVLERRGSVLGVSTDRNIVVPARSPVNGLLHAYNQADVIALRVPGAQLLASAQLAVEGAMRARLGVRPGEADDFDTTTSASMVAAWKRLERLLLIVVPSLTGVALVVTALVSANVMLVVVTERVPEIGLRKALGARRADILRQFLAESVVLSVSGGLVGVALGHAFLAAASRALPLDVRATPWSVAVGLLVGVGVGLGAGVLPAYRASRLTPIAALGRE